MRNIKILFPITVTVVILFFMLRLEFQNRSSFTDLSDRLRTTLKNIGQKVNEEESSIMFLKAHKCASTTVQNILMRYGYVRGLDFVLPSKGNYIGNPEPFQASFIPTELTSPTRKYHIFTHHTRYNYSEMKSIMKPNCKFVTILRDPASLYESLYQFYKIEGMTNVSFADILKSNKNWSKLKRRFLGKIGVNQMSWDLGYVDNLIVEDFIKNIDKEFDLVMMSEYMEASLVLLAKLLHWPLEYVVSLKLNSRQENKLKKLSEDERDQLLKLNSVDADLYDHFYEKFQKLLINYGKDKIMDDVNKLMKLNSNLRYNCVEKLNANGYAKTTNYDLRNNLNWTCVYSTKTELRFTDEIRADQKERFKTIKKLELLLEESSYING